MSINSGISSLATYTNYFFLNSKPLGGHNDSDVREIFKRTKISREIHKLIVFSSIIQAEAFTLSSLIKKSIA